MDLHNLPAAIAGLTDARRPIRLRISSDTGLCNDLLTIKHVSGTEKMCGGLEYTLLCVSPQAGIPLKQFIANPVEVQFVTASGTLRSICGIVVTAAEGHSDGALATYQLIVRDAFSLLDHTCNTRIFRNASEVDITNILLREWRENNPAVARAFEFDLGRLNSYPQREFTMQYNESNAAFLRRLWKRRGIAWFIQAGPATEGDTADAPVHTLVLFDDVMSLKASDADPANFHHGSGNAQRDSITAWHAVRTLTPGTVSRRSWDYAQAWSMGSEYQNGNDQGVLGRQFAASLDDYLADVPHVAADGADCQSLGATRMKRREYESKRFHGEGGDRHLQVGQWRCLEGHPEIDTHPPEERAFVVTELQIDAENNLPESLDTQVASLFVLNCWPVQGLVPQRADGTRYMNRFTCVRRGTPIVPAYDPRVDLPRTEAQTVIVVGPANEEIHCDRLGRVKVRFPACRVKDHAHAQGAGTSDTDRDSAWLRPASGWAGAGYGALSLPRAGDELVIVFLGGDPDKPIIVGRVHNGKRPAPIFSHASVLPGDKHLSGIVSKEAGAQRTNQLRMDDTPGQISAQLESEHGYSQLNLGFLTHPRHDARAEARGEGAELRSDQAVAIRGAQGVLISADASLRAAGRHLQRDGLNGIAEALTAIQKQLAELAETHNTGGTQTDALAQLSGNVRQWDKDEAGSANHAERAGKPVVAIDAPAGMLIGSQANIAIGAQSHVDIISAGNTQLSSGRELLLQAMERINLFAHALGVKLTAAKGKVEIQAHDDNIELTAAKRIVLTATEEIVIQSPKLTIVTHGAQAVYGGGGIKHQCTGAYTVGSAEVAFCEPEAGSNSPLPLPRSMAMHDQRVRITDFNTATPLANQRYRATLEDGQVIEGVTDAEGLTEVLKSSIPFGRYTIEALFD